MEEINILDLEDIGFGTAALLKFLMSLFGLGPEASERAETIQRTQTVTAIYAAAEPSQLKEASKVLQRRLTLLGIAESSIVVEGETLNLTISTSKGPSQSLDLITRIGRVDLAVNDQVLIEAEEFEHFDLRPRGEIHVALSEAGKRKLATWTSENIGQALPLRLDGEILMSPIVKEPIRDGKVLISGISFIEVSQLGLYLQSGPLPTRLSLMELK